MFSNRDLTKLLIPLMIEQVLTSLIGTIDTMMVTRLGQAAVSGVSCVDSINKLIIFMLASIATGGTIVCSQYIGKGDRKSTGNAARQVIICAFFVSIIILVICVIFREQILHLIFGSVDKEVMDCALEYYLVTIYSYPFIALFNAGAALFRAAGNSRLPMIVSAAYNVLNIIGNYILLFVVKIGVAGAAWATTISMAVGAVFIMIMLFRRTDQIDVGKISDLRPDFRLMYHVLKVGVPTGVENSMFQLGKLVVQSTVALLGTMAIASNAICVSLEYLTTVPSQGIAIGLITVAGQCIGAGRLDEAKKNIKKLTLWAAVVLFVWNWLIFAFTVPVCRLSGLDAETTQLTFNVMLIISIIKPITWPLAFLPSNGMRAAGDGTFSMVTASLSMWIARVGLTLLLCRVMGFGLIGIWCGYFFDWAVRSVINVLRYRSGKWTKHKVMT